MENLQENIGKEAVADIQIEAVPNMAESPMSIRHQECVNLVDEHILGCERVPMRNTCTVAGKEYAVDELPDDVKAVGSIMAKVQHMREVAESQLEESRQYNIAA